VRIGTRPPATWAVGSNEIAGGFSEMLRRRRGFPKTLPKEKADSRTEFCMRALQETNSASSMSFRFEPRGQVERQAKRAENGNYYYDVWTSSSPANAGRNAAARGIFPDPACGKESPRSDYVRTYVIDASRRPAGENWMLR